MENSNSQAKELIENIKQHQVQGVSEEEEQKSQESENSSSEDSEDIINQAFTQEVDDILREQKYELSDEGGKT